MWLHLHREGVGHDSIHGIFCEGVKVFVVPSHELRLQSVAAPPIVFKHEKIELCGEIWKEIMINNKTLDAPDAKSKLDKTCVHRCSLHLNAYGIVKIHLDKPSYFGLKLKDVAVAETESCKSSIIFQTCTVMTYHESSEFMIIGKKKKT